MKKCNCELGTGKIYICYEINRLFIVEDYYRENVCDYYRTRPPCPRSDELNTTKENLLLYLENHGEGRPKCSYLGNHMIYMTQINVDRVKQFAAQEGIPITDDPNGLEAIR